MKKGILLSIGALVLLGVIGFILWYIYEEGRMRTGTKESFIPYNSAMVVSVNAKPELPRKWARMLGGGDREKGLLEQVADSLRETGRVVPYPYALAVRVEGKRDVAFLYVMEHVGVLSRSEMASYLSQTFSEEGEQVRKYDQYKIYTLKQGKKYVYFAVCGGIVLLSDSDLYIEDGLKQFDAEEAGESVGSRFQNVNKYFSAGAGVNVFMNTEMFTELLPLYVQTGKMFSRLDVTRLFRWGALDGEFSPDGISLNGFMHYAEESKSYIRTFAGQAPRESSIDKVLPARAVSLGVLNLSHPDTYFGALEAYRRNAGKINKINARKLQYGTMLGKGAEEELRKLLQGEFAMAYLGYNEATEESDGLVVASLKSGGLGKEWLAGILAKYARFDDMETDDYARRFKMDKERAFTYYRFPVEDLPAVYWGYIFEGLKSRYVLVKDNYLVFATSERAVESFLRDGVHGNSVRDAEWYRHLKGRMAGKYNLAYWARTAEMWQPYKGYMRESARDWMKESGKAVSLFPSFGMQWSNEGDILYSSVYVSTKAVQDDARPHVLWQTKLEAGVTMKPVAVTNHTNGEQEFFVQDDKHTIYLINDAGRVLWKQVLEERINSDVYQVDLFKNGKLQYLFSTPSRIYLIDRNGNPAGHFPVTLRAKGVQGISLYDYDGKKDYRIFVPCADRKVYLYGLDGRPVTGWAPANTDAPAVTKVQHFRVEGKDYIVFADRYRLYILDRRGNERVKVKTVFDLPDPTDLYLVRKGGRPRLVFAGVDGRIHLVDFTGRTESVKVGKVGRHFRMNVADVDRDGEEECIFTSGDCLLIYKLNGTLLLEKSLEGKHADMPYVYRFSYADMRIGLTDAKERKMWLLTTGGAVSKGFPIAGDSPFSIVFAEDGAFYLFAGADEGTLIKYRVQR